MKSLRVVFTCVSLVALLAVWAYPAPAIKVWVQYANKSSKHITIFYVDGKRVGQVAPNATACFGPFEGGIHTYDIHGVIKGKVVCRQPIRPEMGFEGDGCMKLVFLPSGGAQWTMTYKVKKDCGACLAK